MSDETPHPAGVHVRVADFGADYAEIRRIRVVVFVGEQRVPEDIEMDDRDPHCVHVLARAGAETVGTGRIDLEKGGKVGRVAVLSTARRRGTGTALMQALHAIADDHGVARAWCHAQTTVVPFYERLGYHVTGDPFLEAGIEHVRMERPP